MSLAEKLFGSFSDRELKKINPLTKQVLALEGKYQAMSDAELQAQTPALKQKLADGKTLDDILPDAFAVGQLLLESRGLGLQLCVRKGRILGLQCQHLLDNGIDLFQLPVGEAAKEFFNKGHRSHLINLKNRAVMRPESRITIQVYDTPKRQTRQICKAILACFYMNFL